MVGGMGSTITNNLISNNDLGVEVSRYCNVYHNSFINNKEHTDWGRIHSTWDDGRYGNYWDDYKERYPDAKESKWRPGTWDTPYEIGLDDIDRYPLVNQWPDPRPRTSYDSFFVRFLDGFPLLKEVILRLTR
jgi:parallel beta-helix repeat protein